MAFMGAAELPNGKFGLRLDLVYADLRAGRRWALPASPNELGELGVGDLFPRASRILTNERTSSTLRRCRCTPISSLDARNARFQFSRDTSVDWVDPIVGVRGAIALSERWTLSGFADVGGFDGSSDLSWEVYGGANYAFAERWAATIGFTTCPA